MSDGGETMAKRWSVTSLVVLALLGSFLGTEVDAAPQYGGSKTQSQNPVRQQGSYSGAMHVSTPPATGTSAATYGIHMTTSGSGTYGTSGTGGTYGTSGTGGSYGTSGTGGTYGTSSNPYQNPQKPQSPQTSNTLLRFEGFAYDQSQTASKQKADPKPPVVQTPPKQNPKNPKPQTPTKPQTPQLSSDQNAQNPTIPQTQKPWILPIPPSPVESCEVDRATRVTCGAPDVSASDCEALNCCHDGRHCYYGKAVTVQCTRDGQFILVVAKDATLPSLDTDSVHLMGSGPDCECVDSNSAFAIFQFPVTGCGSMIREESGVIVYENRMTSSFTVDQGPEGVITRDSHFEVLFQCRYIGTSVQALVVDVLKLDNPPRPVAGLGPLRVAMMLGNGQCHTKGCDEVSAAYSSFYTEADYPVAKVLREPVYVDIHIVDKKNPIYVLTLDRCWATTSPNPHSMPQWDILVDGCPYRDDNYETRMVPVPSSMDFATHHKRFYFKMFTFVEPNAKTTHQQNLFIHCTTAVCLPAPNRRCEPLCMRKKRDVTDVEQVTVDPKTVVSSGLVVMLAPQE